MKKHLTRRLMAMLLAVVLCVGMVIPAAADSTPVGTAVTLEKVDNSAVSAELSVKPLKEAQEEPPYSADDMVRVSIVLKTASTMEAGFSAQTIAANAAAMAYRAELKQEQAAVTAAIERQALQGRTLDVVWNLTLAANIVSANVEYGQIEAIETVPGVEKVLIETRYSPDVVAEKPALDPNMSTSATQTGAAQVWAAGYTGTGSKIAVIDTGIDTDHQSFDAGAFEYALGDQNVNLMDQEDIAAVLDQLNIVKMAQERHEQNNKIELITDAGAFYVSSKIPFAYNYVDTDRDITHDNDTQGEHGSHVAGIATANAYIPDASVEDGYANALNSVLVQGTAPDAQLLVMKVFGKSGGAYDSDYMAAIEDAMILGADVANLSLGSGFPGMARNSTEEYQSIMDNLAAQGMTVVISAGNNGMWADYSAVGKLYIEDIGTQTGGEPGSYANAFTVASVENAGQTGLYLTTAGRNIFYAENIQPDYRNEPLVTLAQTEPYEYVFMDGYGDWYDWSQINDEIPLTGKIAICSRGGGEMLPFSIKADNAAYFGAAATIIYNNEPGLVAMDLSAYYRPNPCVMVTQEDGAWLKENAVKHTTSTGFEYYVGTMTISDSAAVDHRNPEYQEMSYFSSWGVPGDLSLKPEITAPGGNIYSVNGSVAGGKAYENMSGTSMAAPQVAGMEALMSQYFRSSGLLEKTGLTARQLSQSLLMSTAEPVLAAEGQYYPVLQQGAGLAKINDAIAAQSYLWMTDDATASAGDGKIKAELGDDANRNGVYTFSFSIHDLSGTSQTYALSGDFFTQSVLTEGGVRYMDVETVNLDTDVTFSTGDTVTVPANGSANVTVTIRLTAEQKAELNETYPNGTYLEGFVFAESTSTEEGVVGTAHSIPVLGFYGNWTDPSMFDDGASYVSRASARQSYTGEAGSNTLIIDYPGELEEYRFGGNPILPDSVYMPERNSLNSDSVLDRFSFVPIRNAGAYRTTILNERTQEYLRNSPYAEPLPSSYYAAGSGWAGTFPRIPLRFKASSYDVQEGDQLTFAFTLAPEYYVAQDGTVAWDELGRGATITLPMVVDNQAPEIVGDVVIDNGARTLTVELRDNRYVAGVGLYNLAGTEVLSFVGAKEDIEEGASASYTLDITGVNGSRFFLKAFDYAKNAVTYKVTTQIGEVVPPQEMIAFNADLQARHWISFNKDSQGYELPAFAPSDYFFYAATIVDHKIFASTETGDFYVMDEIDPSAPEFIRNLGMILSDMAYNQQDGLIYAVDDQFRLVTIEPLSSETAVVATLPMQTTTLACDASGNFYCNQLGTDDVYSFTLDALAAGEDLTMICSVDELYSESYGLQAMEINPNNGLLCWTSYTSYWDIFRYAYYTEIDLTTNTATVYNDLWNQITCLVIPDQNDTDGSDWTTTDTIEEMLMSPESVNMLRGTTQQLNATVLPWTVSNRSVTWTTSDPGVAMVNENGLVVAVEPGECVITAVSSLDPSFTSSCTVNVYALDVVLQGALQDVDGTSKYFTWDLLTQSEWVQNPKLSFDGRVTSVESMTRDTRTGDIYLMDSNPTNLYKLSDETGETLMTYVNNLTSFRFHDMAYSQVFSTAEEPRLVGIQGFQVTFPMAPNGLDNQGDQGNGFDFLMLMFNNAGYAAEFRGITSMGETTYTTDGGEELPAERFLLLDGYGNFWSMVLFQQDGSYDCVVDFYQTELDIEAPGYENSMYCSMVLGANGKLYLAAYDGETSQLYEITLDEEARTAELLPFGNFGDSVWPASLYAVHTVELQNAKAPTCTEDGYTGDRVCVGCGDVIEEGEVIPATGHTYENGVCTGCGAEEPREPENPEKPVPPVAPEVIIPVIANEMPFTDVYKTDWYFGDVEYVWQNGLMNGVGGDLFAPNASLTRAMVVTILYRMEGEPAFGYASVFGDVTAGQWYTEAVEWAAANGIVNGYSNGNFGPNDAITREQLAAILYRCAASKGIDVSGRANLNGFVDAGSVSSYARDAMSWAVYIGLINGSGNKLLPTGTATRAQTAAILRRLCENVLG